MRPLFPVIEPDLRRLMGAELARDIAADRVYRSVRLRPDAFPAYLDRLASSVASLTLDEFARSLQPLMAATALSGPSQGRPVPSDAARVLATCELNFYYMRAVCADAVEWGHREVEFVRFRAVARPRATGRWFAGDRVDAATALASLRARDTSAKDPLGLARPPHSGLTLRVISAQSVAARRWV